MGGDLHFKEVIRPPLWLLLFIALLLFSMVIAIWAAFDNHAALYSAIVALFLLALFYRSNIHHIEISAGELRVDGAHIELKYLGDVKLLPQAEFLIARTRTLDPAAYPALIYWVSRGVQISIEDERDSTPYWLISTRRGEELRALLANRL